MTMGIAATSLSDDDLRRELAQLKAKQDDISETGTPDQQANHRQRTAELEAEFVARFAPHANDGEPAEQSHNEPSPVADPGGSQAPPAGE